MPGTATTAASRSSRRIASTALATAPAVDGRSAGSLASMDMISARGPGGTSLGSGGGGSLTCARAIAICESPVNGRFPARHS